MLPPMRPKPMIPSCIENSLLTAGPRPALRADRVLDRSLQPRQSVADIRTQMNAQRAAASLRQHLKVAACLRRFDHAERIALAGDGEIGGRVRGDLEKHAGVRSAFVGLTG